MQRQPAIRGDRFIDRLGGVTEAILALASLGIVASRRESPVYNAMLGALYLLEVVGAIAIIGSRLSWMRYALLLFCFRVGAGLALMSVVHGDKLARSTLGFPLVVALYCWIRVRALRAEGQDQAT